MSWSYSYTSEIWPALIALALVIYLGSYSWRQRNIPAAKPFTIACFLSGFWTLGVILELSAVDFSTKVFWVKFQGIWQLPVATAVTCFVLQYAGLGRWLNRRNYIVLFLVPLLSVLATMTNDFHHLIWTGFRMNEHVVASQGRLYWVSSGYIYLLGLVNFTVLVWLAISSPGHRWPVAIIVFGQIFARLGYTLDRLDATGPGESVLLVIGVVSVAYALAFFRFHAIDPVAEARAAALKQMHRGIFVLDLQGRIVDVNPVAAALLGVPVKRLREKPLSEVMPIDADLMAQLGNEGEGQTDITLGEENSARQYTLTMTPLKGRYGELIGRLLLLHDITEEKRAQSRILKQQKVVAMLQERERLARELHDGIGQMLAAAQLHVKSASELLARGDKAMVESCLQRLAEVTQEAKESIRAYLLGVKAGSSSGGQGFVPFLSRYLDGFSRNYGIRAEIVASSELENKHIDPVVEIQLEPIVQEALTNVGRHSGADSVRVMLRSSDSRLQVKIEDNGRGFNPEETGKKQGFGLRSMQGRAEAVGGLLEVDSAPGRGTRVIVCVPWRKEGS